MTGPVDADAAAFFAASDANPPPGTSRWEWARDLADAERWARLTGVVLEWRPDPDPTHEGFECYAFLPDGTLAASIADVPDPTSDQRRVVEAQVALEAMEAWGERGAHP